MAIWGMAQGMPRRVRAVKLGEGLVVLGVPPGRARSMRDRVWAALGAAGMALEGPARVTVEPRVGAGRCHGLDAAIALAALICTGAVTLPVDAMVWGTLGPRDRIRPVPVEDRAPPGVGAAVILLEEVALNLRRVSTLGELVSLFQPGLHALAGPVDH